MCGKIIPFSENARNIIGQLNINNLIPKELKDLCQDIMLMSLIIFVLLGILN